MNNNDLRALLHDALGELRVLASYLDSDYPWPTAGLLLTAKAHDRMVKRIEAALAAEPGEEVTLREENLALRAALRVRSNDEEWRMKFLDAETRCVEATKDRDRLQDHNLIWRDTARKIIEMFDPLHPGADHVLLMYVAKGVKQANENLREIKAKASRAADFLGQEAECEGLRLDNIDVLAEKVVEKLRDQESQLEDADLVTQDALGHARAAAEGERNRAVVRQVEIVVELERDLDRIALALGLAERHEGRVIKRASVEQMLDEIGSLQRRMPTVDALVRRLQGEEEAESQPVVPSQTGSGALVELARHERHHRHYNAVFERHLASGCGVDEAHQRTQKELTKGSVYIASVQERGEENET